MMRFWHAYLYTTSVGSEQRIINSNIRHNGISLIADKIGKMMCKT